MKKPSKSLQQSDSVWIDIDDFEFICFNLAKELLAFDEPIPEYKTTNISLLESALASSRQSYAGKLLYPTLEEQASILF